MGFLTALYNPVATINFGGAKGAGVPFPIKAKSSAQRKSKNAPKVIAGIPNNLNIPILNVGNPKLADNNRYGIPIRKILETVKTAINDFKTIVIIINHGL